MHPGINVAQEVVVVSDKKKKITAPADPKVLLNKRTEQITKCCHGNKFILNRVK